MKHRVPSEWPAHWLLGKMLRAARQLTRAEVKSAQTFAAQLLLLQKIPGWSDSTSAGNVNESFASRLDNAMELIYFGVDAGKVRAVQAECKRAAVNVSQAVCVSMSSGATMLILQIACLDPKEIVAVHIQLKRLVADRMSAFKNRHDRNHSVLDFKSAIPAVWKGKFPIVYVVPTDLIMSEALFCGHTVVSKEAVSKMRALLKRDREDSDEDKEDGDDAAGQQT